MFKRIMITCALAMLATLPLEARIKLVGFQNDSQIRFKNTFADGYNYRRDLNRGVLIDQEGATIESRNGNCKIIFEDAGRSGENRPYWVFSVYVERQSCFPYGGHRVHYADIYYDGDGEVSLWIDREGKLEIIGGYDVAYICHRHPI